MALKFRMSKRTVRIFFWTIFLLPFVIFYLTLPQTSTPPKLPTIAEYIGWSDDVIIARGLKIHWVKSGEPVEFVGPPSPEIGYTGPQLLEADIVSVMHCKDACPKAGKVFITLDGFAGFVGRDYPIQDGHDLIGVDMIYLIQEGNGSDVAKAYPKQLIGPWNVKMTDRRTAYPMSAKTDIEQILRTQANK